MATKEGNSVQLAVAEQIAKLNERVEGEVIEVLVAREVDRRTKAMVDVIDKLDQAKKELNKINRADQVFYDEEGKAAVQTLFTKGRIDEIKKAKEKIAKIEGAINKALDEKADWSGVFNLSSGKQPDGSSQSSGSGDQA